MSEDSIIAEWLLNKRQRARVSIDRYNGYWLINVRKWFEAKDGPVRPGKGGIALNVKHLPQLTEAVSNAPAAARALGLVSGPTDNGSAVP